MDLDRVFRAAGRLPLNWIDAKPGEKLRALRQDRRVSQAQLAQEAGLAQSVVCRLEKGADARLSTWKALFEALGYYAVLTPFPVAEEIEDLLNEGRERRQQRAEDGRAAGRAAARWRR